MYKFQYAHALCGFKVFGSHACGRLASLAILALTAGSISSRPFQDAVKHANENEWRESRAAIDQISSSALSLREKSRLAVLDVETDRKTGKKGSAISKAESYLKTNHDPDQEIMLRIALGESLASLKRFDAAKEQYSAIAIADVNEETRNEMAQKVADLESERLFDQAIQHGRNGKIAETTETYKTIFSRNLDPIQQIRMKTVMLLFLAHHGGQDTVLAEAPGILDSGIKVYGTDKLTADLVRAYQAKGDVESARRYSEQLQKLYPDSLEFALIQQESGPSDGAQSEATVRMKEAETKYEAAAQAIAAYDNQRGFKLLNGVLADFPDTPAAYRALDSRAHLSLREKDDASGRRDLEALVSQLGKKHPESFIVEKARSRLAMLYKKDGQLEACDVILAHLANHARDREIASHAAVNLVANHFEVLQDQTRNGKETRADDWESLRKELTALVEATTCTQSHRATSNLMLVETYDWTKEPQRVVEEADKFIERFPDAKYLDQAGTVRYFQGTAYINLKQHGDAIPPLKWIIDHHKYRASVWPGTNLLQRSYFNLWHVYRRVKDFDRALAVAAEFEERFPESNYNTVIREWDTKNTTTAVGGNTIK